MRPAVSLQTDGDNVRLYLAYNNKWQVLPFCTVDSNTYNASYSITKYNSYLLVHTGINRGAPTKIQLESLASATSDVVGTNPKFSRYGIIAGCFLDKRHVNCYVVTLKTTDYIPKTTPNLIQTLFDNAAKIFVFDFKTPAIILTDYKLSDIIDEIT